MVNKPLIRPYFWGGYVGGGTLTSHDFGVKKDGPKKKTHLESYHLYIHIGSMGLVYLPT